MAGSYAASAARGSSGLATRRLLTSSSRVTCAARAKAASTAALPFPGADVEAQVARDAVPGERRPGPGRGEGVDHCRQRLVVDRDQVGRIPRLGERLGHHHRNRIADVAHAVPGEYRPRRFAARRAVEVGHRDQAGNVAEPVCGDVRAGEDGEHAGRLGRSAGIDADDLRMRVRRAHDRGVGGACDLDIIGIAACAAQQRCILDAGDGLAEGELGHLTILPVINVRYQGRS